MTRSRRKTPWILGIAGCALWGMTSFAVADTQPSPHAGLLNHAQPDGEFWARANHSFYLTATTMGATLGAASPLVGPPLVQFGVHEALQISLSRVDLSGERGTVWLINSPDAQIQWDAAANAFVFRADEPGIYTLQAKVGSAYSIPLVVTVAKTALPYTPLQTAMSMSGILPFPAQVTILDSAWENDNLSGVKVARAGISDHVYAPIGNYIPISGHAAGRTHEVTVELWHREDRVHWERWSYSLPVIKGNFAAQVLAPYGGTVYIDLYASYFRQLNHFHLDGPQYALQIPEDIDVSQRDLLASAYFDWNLSPALQQEAARLMDNSPSIDTAIAAISNDVGETVLFNSAAVENHVVPWQSAAMTWHHRMGVDQNIADVVSAMLRSVGIPTEMLVAKVGGLSHEWIRAYDGHQWIAFDPTWDVPQPSQSLQQPVTLIDNKYMDNSTYVQQIGHIDADKSGLDS